MCLTVSVLICPMWSGAEQHLLTTRNMDKLADAVEACVEDYFAEALNSCAGAEVQAPPHVKRLLRDVCTRVGAWCAWVLREASSRSVATMTTSSSGALDFAVTDMNTAVQELQGDMRTPSTSWRH